MASAVVGPAVSSSMSHYSLLGVSSNCSSAELSSAFRSKALQLHPDKQKGSGVSQSSIHASFLQLQQAYSVLRYDETRRQYDAALKACGLNLISSSGSACSLPVTEIDLDDLAFDDDESSYSYHCRCGAELRVYESSLLSGVDLCMLTV